MSNPVEMNAGEFADWAEQEYGVDYDDVSLWDMQNDLSTTVQMPAEFEIGAGGTIPAALYDILVARKAARVTVNRPAFDGRVRLTEWEIRGTDESGE